MISVQIVLNVLLLCYCQRSFCIMIGIHTLHPFYPYLSLCDCIIYFNVLKTTRIIYMNTKGINKYFCFVLSY